ncbi:GNAT family N-acetyltransferase [Vibrio profundum]|uniref:GNAT family N-acetyltransferase n=1 Tax=Vibrio profundum TaxID=2910247 RepID=UPI003D0BD331
MKMELVSLSHAELVKPYFAQCVADGLELYRGAIADSNAYLSKRIAYGKGLQLPEGWPPISLYFCIDSGSIVGAIRLRHGTNEYIEREIGHIGYETLPQARGKGVASFMLAWLKEQVVESNAILICDADNAASQKVIENSGGQYMESYYSAESQCEVVSYRLAHSEP